MSARRSWGKKTTDSTATDVTHGSTPGCQKVSAELYRILQKYEEEKWFCKKCHSEIKQLDGRIRDLQMENKDLKERVHSLEQKWELFKEELKEETVKCTMERVSHEMNKHMEELEERNKRKNNVVLYNVPESTKEDPKERQSDDMVRCCDLFEGSLRVMDVKMESTVRMGKKEEGRKRPLLVKLSNENEKKSILANAKNLKGEENPWKKTGRHLSRHDEDGKRPRHEAERRAESQAGSGRPNMVHKKWKVTEEGGRGPETGIRKNTLKQEEDKKKTKKRPKNVPRLVISLVNIQGLTLARSGHFS